MTKSPAPQSSDQSDRLSQHFSAIGTLIYQGKSVVSSEDSAVVEWAIRAIRERKTATLYCKPAVYEVIRRWYWTPEHVKLAGFKPISAEQAARIKSDFNITLDGYANSMNCPRCGHVYSTYEFIHQGIEQHGEEQIRAAFTLRGTAILQINPVQDVVCRNCRLNILVAEGGIGEGTYDYEYRIDLDQSYACCRWRTILADAPSGQFEL